MYFQMESSIDSKMSPEICELTLSKGKYEDCVLYKLKKGMVLRYKLGPDCLAEDVTLYTTYPPAGWVPSPVISCSVSSLQG